MNKCEHNEEMRLLLSQIEEYLPLLAIYSLAWHSLLALPVVCALSFSSLTLETPPYSYKNSTLKIHQSSKLRRREKSVKFEERSRGFEQK